jgi:putative tryptophan/tyrosine transport system substrate-binding protein
MKRRAFITLLGGAAMGWPFAARAQQPDGMRRIGMLMAYAQSDFEGQLFVATFVEGLAKLGWVEGRTIQFDVRWAPASADADSRLRVARELIAFRPDLILSHGTPNTSTLHQLTRTVPIVFVNASDPIGSGFVASFPRPGGNVTGFYHHGTDDGRQVAGVAQGDSASHYQLRIAVQPGNRAICELFRETVQRRCRVLGSERHHSESS